MQYPVIYAFLSRLNHCLVIASSIIMLSWWKVERKKKKVKKIDDLPVLATSQFGTSVMFPSKVNGPVAHRSTQ